MYDILAVDLGARRLVGNYKSNARRRSNGPPILVAKPTHSRALRLLDAFQSVETHVSVTCPTSFVRDLETDLYFLVASSFSTVWGGS